MSLRVGVSRHVEHRGVTLKTKLYKLFDEEILMRRQIDNSLLEMALVGYQARHDEVLQKMADIKRQMGATPVLGARRTGEKKPKRKMSAAGRKAIAEAQRRRWAASKKAAEPPAPPGTRKAKRKLSRAGRAAIIAATKKGGLKRAEAAKATSRTTTKSAPAKTAKKVTDTIAVRKAAPRKPAPVKKAVKAPGRKAAKKSESTAQPTAAAPTSTTENLVQ
jgi:hypothetical protein